MAAVTLDELKAIMRVTAGVDETVDLDGDIEDTPFTDLGYDSLAIFEFASELERRYDHPIADRDVPQLTTPRTMLQYLNAHLASAEARP